MRTDEESPAMIKSLFLWGCFFRICLMCIQDQFKSKSNIINLRGYGIEDTLNYVQVQYRKCALVRYKRFVTDKRLQVK